MELKLDVWRYICFCRSFFILQAAMSTFPCHIVLFTGYLAALCQGLMSADNPQLCEEDPPPCSYLYKYYDDFTPLFETAAHGRVLRHVYTFKVDSSQSLCSIDPFINIEPDIKDHIPTMNMHFEFGCVAQSTRIVLRPSMWLTNSSAFTYLFVNNCTVYWKEISLFGQSITMLVLQLFNSRDEFANGEDHYFYDCVEYKESMNSSEDGAYPIVRGLEEVGTLVMAGLLSTGYRRLLLNHSWPAMAEITLQK